MVGAQQCEASPCGMPCLPQYLKTLRSETLRVMCPQRSGGYPETAENLKSRIQLRNPAYMYKQ